MCGELYCLDISFLITIAQQIENKESSKFDEKSDEIFGTSKPLLLSIWSINKRLQLSNKSYVIFGTSKPLLLSI